MEDDSIKVLLVDDDEDDFILTQSLLEKAHQKKFSLDWASSYEQGLNLLVNADYDVALVDYDLGAFTGIDLIRQAGDQGSQVPVLIVTGHGSYQVDLDAMHAGAMDYIGKGELNTDLLERTIRYIIERSRVEQQMENTNQALSAANLELAKAYLDLQQERKRLKDLLTINRQNEERFQLASRAVSGIVYEWDLTNNHVFRSDGIEQVLGLKVKDIPDDADWWVKRIHPEDVPVMKQTVANVLESGGSVIEQEYRVQHKDGSWVDVWDRAFVIRDEQGKPVRMIGTSTDITHRRRVEQNTRYIARLGETLLELTHPQEMIDYATRSIAIYLGVERCLVGESAPEGHAVQVVGEYHQGPPALEASYRFSSDFDSLFKGLVPGSVLVVDNTLTDPAAAHLYDSGFKPLEISSFAAVPIFRDNRWQAILVAASSNLRHWREDELGLLRHASDLLWLAVENARLLENLTETQERFHVALKNSEITVFTTDREGRYTWIYNPRSRHLMTDMIGKRDDEIPNVTGFEELMQIKQRVLSERKGVREEVRLVVDGKPVYYDMTIEPLFSPEGELLGLTAAAMDTTRGRQMEVQVRESARKLSLQREILKHREEERQQIARELHDGPIQSLVAMIFSLQMASTFTEEDELKEVINELKNESHHLVGELRMMCNELRPPALIQFGLLKAIQSHAATFQERYPQLDFSLKLCENIPPLPENTQTALYRIYQECLNNIQRHSDATEVQVSLESRDNLLLLEVADNGSGFIPPDDWVEFARKGHLGMVGMKERAEAIGASLQINSQPKGGTRVRVELSLDAAPAEL